MRSKLYVFPDDSGAPAAGKAEVHRISHKYIGAQRDRMREQLLKGSLHLGTLLNAIFR